MAEKQERAILELSTEPPERAVVMINGTPFEMRGYSDLTMRDSRRIDTLAAQLRDAEARELSDDEYITVVVPLLHQAAALALLEADEIVPKLTDIQCSRIFGVFRRRAIDESNAENVAMQRLIEEVRRATQPQQEQK